MKKQFIISGALLVCIPLIEIAATAQQPVQGFADLHAHPATHLAFGADGGGSHGILWGKPASGGLDLQTATLNINSDLSRCETTNTVLFPGPASLLSILIGVEPSVPYLPVPTTSFHGAPGDYVQLEVQRGLIHNIDKQVMPQLHRHDGAPGFGDWPSALVVEHQQMHLTAVKRAYDGGLRLMIAATTDNQLLSTLWTNDGWNLNPSVPNPDPNFDYNSAVKQLKFIRSLVDANSSWMQIVKSPAEARAAINGNKLAVILSLEMDALSLGQITQLVSAYDVRHVIPIHLANSSFGGTAVYDDLFNTNNWFLNNHQFFKVDFDPAITFRLKRENTQELVAQGLAGPMTPRRAYGPNPINDDQYNALGYEQQPPCLAGGPRPCGGHKNNLGLSDIPAFVKLMKLGLLIDVAHMSEKAAEMALTQAETYGYPLMDSHTGIRKPSNPLSLNERSLLPSQATRIGNLGGVIGLGPSWNKQFCTDPNSPDPISDFLTDYQNALRLMGGKGVALGTDANGFQQLINCTKSPLKDYTKWVASENQPCPPPSQEPVCVGAPLVTGLPAFYKYTVGQKTYDINTDGLANYGMLPDFLQALNESEQSAQSWRPGPSVTAMFHSAEDVIEMWEKVMSASSNLPHGSCRQPDYNDCVANADDNFEACKKDWDGPPTHNSVCSQVLVSALSRCSDMYCHEPKPTQLAVKERVFPSVDPGRFSLKIDGAVELPSVGDQADTGFVTVAPGLHIASEGGVAGTNLANYVLQFGGDCAANDTSQGPFARPVNVAASQQKTCTIANLGFPALHFQYQQFSGKPGNFDMRVDNAKVATSATADGSSLRFNALTTASHQIALSPSDPSTDLNDYTIQFGRDCAGGQATLAAGDEKMCTIFVYAAGQVPCPPGLTSCGPPVVNAVTPHETQCGTTTPVTITGTDLLGTMRVTLNQGPLTEMYNLTFTIDSNTQITANVPNSVGSGIYLITILTAKGYSTRPVNGPHPEQFSVRPIVASISPTSGPAIGGTEVTVSGACLPGSFFFGSLKAVRPYGKPCSGSQCVIASPPAPSVGVVDVVADAGGARCADPLRSGCSKISPTDQFKYGPPNITSVSPSTGPMTGGTPLEITGSGFPPYDGITPLNMQVSFGSVQTKAQCDLTGCSVRTPPVAQPGPVHIIATAFGGSSTPSPADTFTYTQYPALTKFDAGGVLLDGNAPAGGAVIHLNSTDANVVSVPQTVTIDAGHQWTSVQFTLLPHSQTESVTVTAKYQGSSLSETDVYNAWPPLRIVTDVAYLGTGDSTTAGVTINTFAPTGGAVVSLSSSDYSAIPVPTSVTIPAGSYYATFTITGNYSGKPKQVTITASYNGASAPTTLTVGPVPPTPSLCRPHKCPKGYLWNDADCRCESSQPQ